MHGFDLHLRDPRVTVLGGVEVGVDIAPQDLADHFDAVVYAVGASEPRRLGIPGGICTAARRPPRPSPGTTASPTWRTRLRPGVVGRTVLVGTGNVALDIARLFHTSSDALRRTDIADRSLPFFDDNATSEIVLLGRRGPETAAYTKAEFAALAAMPDVEVVTLDADEVDPSGVLRTAAGRTSPRRVRVRYPSRRGDRGRRLDDSAACPVRRARVRHRRRQPHQFHRLPDPAHRGTAFDADAGSSPAATAGRRR